MRVSGILYLEVFGALHPEHEGLEKNLFSAWRGSVRSQHCN